MLMQAFQVEQLTQAGVEALRRSDPQAARAVFEQVVAAGQADAAAHLGMAYAQAMLNDDLAAHGAVDAALAHEPRNLRALLLKADLFQRAGNGSAAATFYQAVLKSVPDGPSLTGEMQREVARARTMADHYQTLLERSIRSTLPDAQSGQRPVSARFAQSVGILLGERKVYLQQPRHYYFPELPQIQFYDREAFAWLPQLERATAAIREELLDVLRDQASFRPYVQRDPSRPALARGGMLDNPDWSAYFLWKNGAIVAEHAARCPRTMAALAQLPLATVPGRSPSVLFSLMRPGAHIPAHNGFVNTRLIGHLPLIVPEGCRFRVGDETRQWVEGQAWVFDDTIEHEAWNDSDQLRVVLLFEVWQPALTADEKHAVSGLFQAIDQLPGGGPAWDL